METGAKRAAESAASDDRSEKRPKQWRVPRKSEQQQGRPDDRDQGRPGNRSASTAKSTIAPGDSGIWATCPRGREARCVGELSDLFAEYAPKLYGDGDVDADEGPDDACASGGIEDAVAGELAQLRKRSSKKSSSLATRLFVPVRLAVPCVVFFKTSPPVDPVVLVSRICEDAMAGHSRTRFVQRLSPVTLMGRASPEGLEELSKQVLKPHFHAEDEQNAIKFAIRPSSRNHNVLNRDSIIRSVASAVGPPHQVDLRNYERLILVEAFQNVCGMAVVDDSFERLKKYNLSEINAARASAADGFGGGAGAGAANIGSNAIHEKTKADEGAEVSADDPTDPDAVQPAS